jgi:hypothetical protein
MGLGGTEENLSTDKLDFQSFQKHFSFQQNFAVKKWSPFTSHHYYSIGFKEYT